MIDISLSDTKTAFFGGSAADTATARFDGREVCRIRCIPKVKCSDGGYGISEPLRLL
jgi:hypothetical protein